MTEADLHAHSLDGHIVLSLRGEIDLENAGRMHERIVNAVPHTTQGIVVDLTAVSHMDSAGVRLLFDLAARLGERRLDVAIVAPPATLLREVLDVVRLDSVATLVESLDEALRRRVTG